MLLISIVKHLENQTVHIGVKMSYYKNELKPLLTLNQAGIKNCKVKIMNSDYTTKWLDINLESIEDVKSFLEIIKKDIE